MASFNRFQSTLSTYNQRLGTADFRNAAPTVTGEYNAKFGSSLGQDVGQTLNGLQSITQIQNYPGEFKDVLLGLALVKLTEAVTGENLFEVIDSAFEGIGSGNANITDVLTGLGTLAVLTGTSPAAGFLKAYYGGSSGIAAATLLSKATGKDISTLVNVVQSVQSGNIKQFANFALQRSISEVLGPIISDFNSRVDLAIGTAIAPVLQAVMDISAGPIGLIVNDLTGGKLKSFELQNIVRLLSQGKYAEAILITSQNSDSPLSYIESTLLGIDTTISTRVTYTGSTTLPVFDIGSDANTWTGANTSTWKDPDANAASVPGYKFTRVGGEQQLEADFRSATREITEAVVHWSATYIDQDIGSQEIHGWHREQGFTGIGYHYVIRRDGTIEKGRPLQYEGAHADANGHNKYSMGICLVGGYTVPSNIGLNQPPQGPESLTAEQMTTLRLMLNTFYKVWPGGQVWGHNDTDPGNKSDPGFNVSTYIRQNFNKENVSSSGTIPPLSSRAISTLRAQS
jgi:N-acetylmuramoyl-L-alanine amidase